jgi:hypothetical protein
VQVADWNMEPVGRGEPCVSALCLFRQLEPKLKEVSQRVLLVVGSGDLLLPSGEEGSRLEKLLPRCRLRVSHICFNQN